MARLVYLRSRDGSRVRWIPAAFFASSGVQLGVAIARRKSLFSHGPRGQHRPARVAAVRRAAHRRPVRRVTAPLAARRPGKVRFQPERGGVVVWCGVRSPVYKSRI